MKCATDLRHYFRDELLEHYSYRELDSLFFWCTDKLLNIDRSSWLLNEEIVLSEDKLREFRSIIARLKKLEPIQYIFEECEFYGLTLSVNPSCLIPRPETEELVRWILQEKFDSVLDIGTGSGCIAIALAKHTQADISALDISEQALAIAEKNARQNDVDIAFFQHNIMHDRSKKKHYDIIVSNPPYVLDSEKKEINPNVLNYEPHLALFVNDSNPLLFYERICQFSKDALKIGGFLFFEINEQKSVEIKTLLELNGFSNVLIKTDMQGKFRMVKAQKKL